MSHPLFLIDASIYIFRHYFAWPEKWHSQEGFPTQAVYGYLSFLLTLIEKQSPIYIAAAFDQSLGSCFRNRIYPDYKANRCLPDDALSFQLNACLEATRLMGIAGLASQTHEADDIIGTLAKQGREIGHRIIVLSGDKDLTQLIGPDDLIWDFGKSKPLGQKEVVDRVGVWPEQMADYLALVGDSSDNIPGVPGIGPKTACALLKHFGSLNVLLQAGDQINEVPVRGAKKLAEKIDSYREQIVLAKRLTEIADDAVLGKPALQRRPIALDALDDFCQRMGLGDSPVGRAEKLTAIGID